MTVSYPLKKLNSKTDGSGLLRRYLFALRKENVRSNQDKQFSNQHLRRNSKSY